MKNHIYYILKIEGEMTDLNTQIGLDRHNRYSGGSNKSIETVRIKYLAIEQGVKMIRVPVYVMIRWCCRNKRKDKDNISFAKKYILDGLVAAKVLEGDGWSHIIGFTDEFVYDKDNPHIEVILSDGPNHLTRI